MIQYIVVGFQVFLTAFLLFIGWVGRTAYKQLQEHIEKTEIDVRGNTRTVLETQLRIEAKLYDNAGQLMKLSEKVNGHEKDIDRHEKRIDELARAVDRRKNH